MGWRGKRFVCWDLDGTMGEFEDYKKMSTTRGMRSLIENLRKCDVHSVVTTAASKEHAEYVLHYAGITPLLDGIFSRELICDEPNKDFNKRYLPVAARLNIDPKDAPHRMIVAGNMERDAPVDLDLTFIHHPFGSTYHSIVFLKILEGLTDLNPSWAYAHTLMMARSSASLPLHFFKGGWQNIGGILLGVGRSYWNSRPGKLSDRLIAVLDVDEKYRAMREEIFEIPQARAL